MKNFSAVGGKLQSKGVYDVKTPLCSKERFSLSKKLIFAREAGF